MTLDYGSDSQSWGLCSALLQFCTLCKVLTRQSSLLPLCISAKLSQVAKEELNSVLVWLIVTLSSVEPAEVLGIVPVCLQV